MYGISANVSFSMESKRGLFFIFSIAFVYFMIARWSSFVYHKPKDSFLVAHSNTDYYERIKYILQSHIELPTRRSLQLSHPNTIDFSQFGQSKVLDRILLRKRGKPILTFYDIFHEIWS